MHNILLVMIFALCAYPVYSQNEKTKEPPCNEPGCIEAKFQYLFCNEDGKSVFKCSSNPNNEPGLKPYKRRLPIEVCPFNLELYGIHDNFKLVKYPPPDPLDPTTEFTNKTIFDASHTAPMLAAAAKAWNSICPPQGPDAEHQQCCLRVRWSTNIEDMRGDNEAYALTFIVSENYGTGKDRTCGFDCNASEMVLNRDPSFIRPDSKGIPERYFITERHNMFDLPMQYEWIDLQSVFEHELGHWLGFHHSLEPDDNGESCGSGQSIMRGGDDPSYWNHRPVTLAPEDRCMFMKLYCCDQTKKIVWTDDPNVPPETYPNHTKPFMGGAEPDRTIGGIGFTVIPNPIANGTVTLSFYGALDEQELSLRIVNAAGQTVFTRELPKRANPDVSVDVSSLSNGVYMMQILQSGRVFGRKFVISD